MATETVQVQWVEDRVFLLQDRFGFPLVMTQPNGVNGADLLPLSLIGCAAWDVLAILQKQRQAVRSFQVTAASEREAEPPWRFTHIHTHYRLGGVNLSVAHVRRAIELSERKYCSIHATLGTAIKLTSDFEILDESGD
jgi:putative redox protein